MRIVHQVCYLLQALPLFLFPTLQKQSLIVYFCDYLLIYELLENVSASRLQTISIKVKSVTHLSSFRFFHLEFTPSVTGSIIKLYGSAKTNESS